MSKRKFRGRKKLFNKNKEELLKFVEDNQIEFTGGLESVVRAGFEGDTHLLKKIEVAMALNEKYKDKYINCMDGVYLEYPLLKPLNNLSLYNKRKLNYLLSIYQKINEIKNLGNIFNANLKSPHRSKKSLKTFEIVKIVDVCVVIGGKEVEAVEIKITNGMTKKVKKQMEELFPGLIKEI